MIIERIDQMVQKADLYYDPEGGLADDFWRFFQEFMEEIFYELLSRRIAPPAKDRRGLLGYSPITVDYLPSSGFRSCYHAFFVTYTEHLIFEPYYPPYPGERYVSEYIPEWNLIKQVLPLIDDFEEYCGIKIPGALHMFLNTEKSVKKSILFCITLWMARRKDGRNFWQPLSQEISRQFTTKLGLLRFSSITKKCWSILKYGGL